MGWTTAYYILQAALTVYSIADGADKARKAKNKIKDAAELRKGFEIVVDGQVSALPLVYGRALVGGNRVFHATADNFVFTTHNADKVFLSSDLANAAAPTSTYEEIVVTYNGTAEDYHPVFTSITRTYDSSDLLSNSVEGSKNEFLYVQQALCQGPINAVLDIIIEDSLSYDDVLLGTGMGPPVSTAETNSKAGFRCEFNYGHTAVANNTITANAPGRATAKFPGAASLSAVIKLNRDEPQFNKVPTIQSIIEGKKVRRFTWSAGTYADETLRPYVYEETKAFSTNPVEILLDYLQDTVVGKALPLSKIDLFSFQLAAKDCARIVRNNVPVGGRIWQPTDGSRNVNLRNIPYYEANIIIDVTQPVRENVNRILNTMPGAKLVWSQGKYKLSFQAPVNNAAIRIAKNLTDDDLVMGAPFTIQEPSSDERLNFATIRFPNESNNFRDDSVSWPPKQNGTYLKGVGANFYPVVSGWNIENAGNVLLNAVGVWNGNGNSSTMTWKFAVKKTGTHTMSFVVDDTGELTVSGPFGTINRSYNAYPTIETLTFAGTLNDVITISIVAGNPGGGPRGFAARVEVDNTLAWNTRAPAFTSFITVNQSNTLYNTLLNEDNGVLLETDQYAEHVTNYYHALAMAEGLVRTSRFAAKVSFSYIVKGDFLEPGDFVKINSSSLSLTDLIVIVDEVKLTEGLVVEVQGTRFDSSQLAWNVADDEYVLPDNGFSLPVGEPLNLVFDINVPNYKVSSGKISWDAPSDAVTGYIVYVYSTGDRDSYGRPFYRELATTTDTSFVLPKLAAKTGMIGIKSFLNNKLSNIVSTPSLMFNTRDLQLLFSEPGFFMSSNGTATPETITLTALISGYDEPVIRWYKNDVLVLDVDDDPVDTRSLLIGATVAGTSARYKLTVEESIYSVGSDISMITQEVDIYSILHPGKSVRLVFDSFYFIFPSVTATTSNSPDINFTADLNNLTGTVTFSATAYDIANASLGSVTLTSVTATTAKLTSTNFVKGLGAAVRYVRVTATLDGFSDTTTVYRGDDGSSNIELRLDNDNHTLPSDSAGNNVDYTGSGTAIQLFQGINQLDYDGVGTSNGTWRLESSVSTGTITIGALSENAFEAAIGNHSAMSTDAATITFTAIGKMLDGTSISISKKQSLTKGRNGSEGISSQVITIYAQAATQPACPTGGSYTFNGDVFVPPSPSAGSTVAWTAASGTTLTLTDSGRTAEVASGAGIRTFGGSPSYATGASDKRYFEIVYINSGTYGDAVRDEYGLATVGNIPGNEPSTSGIGYRRAGNVRVNTSVVVSGAALAANDVIGFAFDLSSRKVWVSLNGVWLASGDPAAGTGQQGTLSAGTYQPQVSSESGSACKVTLNAKTSQLTYAPPTGFVAWGLDDGPTWSREQPASSTTPTWKTDVLVTTRTPGTAIPIGTSPNADWTCPPVLHAQNSTTSATVKLVRKTTTSTPPTLPSAEVTYTFVTGLATGLTESWSQTLPNNSDPYSWETIATATADATLPTDVIAPAEWSAPRITAQNGTNSATVSLVRKTNSSTPPALPSANVTYTFATGVATGLTESWLQTLTADPGSYRWITTATATSLGLTDVIEPAEWSAARITSQDQDVYEITFDPVWISVAAYSNGYIPSYTGANATATLKRNGVVETGDWTMTVRADTHGHFTASVAAAVVSLTNLATNVNGVTIGILFNRVGYPQQSFFLSATKSQSLGTAPAVNRLVYTSPSAGQTWTASTVRYGCKFTNNGQLFLGTKVGAGAWSWNSIAQDNWYMPNTTAIGSSYSLKITEEYNYSASNDLTGITLGVATSLTSDIIFGWVVPTPGTQLNLGFRAYIIDGGGVTVDIGVMSLNYLIDPP